MCHLATRGRLHSPGQPAEYDQLSVTLFVSGYSMIIASEKKSVRPYMLQHLEDLMEDVELYSWETVLAFGASNWSTAMFPGQMR